MWERVPECGVLGDLIPAALAALTVCVMPGWFWAASLRDERSDLATRLAFSIAFSFALVPPVSLLIMWFSGTAVTIVVAVTAPLIVLLSGIAVRLRFVPAHVPGNRPVFFPPSLNPLTFVPLAPALGLILWATLASPGTHWPELVAAPLFVLAGALAWLKNREPRSPSPGYPSMARVFGRILYPAALAAILGAVLARGYVGPVLYDWPYLRGGDQYNHAVQANEMLAVGHYDAFLVYPPGFSTLTASVSRLAGLGPLEVFPVLAPALIFLPALACYALAKDLWGTECGLAAAVFSGLLLNGTWENIEAARYPNLISAQFLLVLMVAALVRLYRSPEPRSALVLAILGSSVVLYHSVGSFYAVLLLALVAALFVPYLLLWQRRRGVALLFSLTLLGVLSVLYAWDTYDLGRLIGGLLTGSETGAGGEAVSIVLGTQPAFSLTGLPTRISPAVFWLGLLGLLLLFAPTFAPTRPRADSKDLAGLLSRATLLLWCAVQFVGSRTALSGFPQRFERDLGIPLSLLAAFALVAILRTVMAYHPAGSSVRQPAASVARLTVAAIVAVLALSLVGTQTWMGLAQAASPAPGGTLTPELAAAGEWLREHNTGGKIIPTPSYGVIPSRGMLALGRYNGLQSYPERRVKTPRSLPPGGAHEIKDARWLLLHPQSSRARSIVERRNVRYVVVAKGYPSIDPQSFEGRPNLYQKKFENQAVVIFAPQGSS